jgi:hypothetical protein
VKRRLSVLTAAVWMLAALWTVAAAAIAGLAVHNGGRWAVRGDAEDVYDDDEVARMLERWKSELLL